MSIEISRRRLLLAAVSVVSSYVPAPAQSPPVVAKPSSGAVTGGIPVSCQTVRLGGLRSDIGVVITAVAIDPLGELLAVAGDDHTIRIMDTASLRTIKRLAAHRDLVRTLAFDPSGGRLVSAGNDGQLIIWSKNTDGSDGRDVSFQIAQRMKGTPALACVCFSNRGTQLAAVGFDNDVFVLGKSRSRRPVFQCDCKDLRAVTFRDDDRVLAVAGRSGDLHLFDPISGRLLGEHSIHAGRIHKIVFHRDSNLAVCVGEDGKVSLFDTERQQLRQSIQVSTGKLFAAAVLDSQRVAVAGSDNIIRVVNTDSGQVETNLEGHQGSVATLAAAGNTIFSGGYDATLRRWAVDFRSQRIAEGDPRIDR